MKKILISIMLILSFAGFAGASQLIYGSGDYTSINPALFEHGEINLLIFTGLTAHDANNKIVPSLAESWSFDTDANTYTFNLRKDAKWHDGEPFTAEDVKFTIESIMNPDNMSEIASNYEDITKIEIIDPHTVKISLSAPNVAMLDYLSIGMIPKHLLEGKPLATAPFNQMPVGTGPYKLTEWDFGQSITLERNSEFYGGAAKIERIIFKIVPDSNACFSQLLSGELDLAQITPDKVSLIAANAMRALEVYNMNTSDYRGIMYNFNNPFFKKHRELPNALSYAVDREAIVKAVLENYGHAAYSPLQFSTYNNPDINRFDYDPAKTRSLLEAAGWKRGSDGIYEKEGERCAFTINNRMNDQVRLDISNIVAQQMKEVGVEVSVEVNAKTDWANQQAFLIGWGSPFDPDDHTYKVFGTNKGSNFSGYSNPKIDKLLTEARATDIESDRKRFYGEFLTEMTNDMPYTFIAYANAIYVANPKIKGISRTTVLGHHGVGIFWNVNEWTLE